MILFFLFYEIYATKATTKKQLTIDRKLKIHSDTKKRPHYMIRWYNEATLKSKQLKQICCFLHHINCPSKRLLEWMKLIEANFILLFVLQSYLSSPYRSNFLRDFSSNLRIHESILMSSLMRHLRRSVKFWQRRKNE